MDAMSYEHMMRRAFHCGRSWDIGADADIYRKLERANTLLTAKNWLAPIEEREHDYLNAAIVVSQYVEEAISKAILEIGQNEKVIILKSLLEKLSMQNDKAIIDEVIEKALDIFVELDLEIR